MRVPIILIGLGLVLGLPTSGQAVDPDVKCGADKIKEAVKYGFCLGKAEAKAIKKGEVPDFAKCDSKYSAKWQKAETKAGGACPTNGDEAAIQAQVRQCVDDVVAVLEPPPCPAGGVEVGGACWYLGSSGGSCLSACDDLVLAYDAATETYAGSGGTLLRCYAVLDALGETTPPNTDGGDAACSDALGCTVEFNFRFRCTSPATTAGASPPFGARACACQ